MVEKYRERYQILGIDLSKAFDCLDRVKLIDIFRTARIGTEDDLRILTYMLAETELQVKIQNEVSDFFGTSIGTPQGDALSPVLFLVYLEFILREYRLTMPPMRNDNEQEYADDVLFYLHSKIDPREGCHVRDCDCAVCRKDELVQVLPPIFSKHNMTMNAGKTEHTELTHATASTTKFYVLGNYLSGDLECTHRIARAQVAFNAMCRIWLDTSKRISLWRKIALYRAMVEPHLTYNAGSCPFTQVHLDRFNAAHRRHLRRLMNIYYPRYISNGDTYERTKQKPISLEITRQRWSMFGHILRLDENTPANKMMRMYYTERFPGDYQLRECNRGGTNITSIPKLLHLDIKKLPKNKRYVNLGVADLETKLQLERLRKTAANRDHWRDNIVKLMVSNAERLWIRREVKRLTKKGTGPNANGEDNYGEEEEDPLIELPEDAAYYVTADMMGLRDQLLRNLTKGRNN